MKLNTIKKIIVYFLAGVGVLSVILFSIFVVVFVSRNSSSSYNAPGTYSSYESSLGVGEKILSSPSRTLDQEAASSGNGGEIEEGELTERKVIKNGSLSLLVKKAEETAQQIKDIAGRLGGYVSYSRIYEVEEGIKSGSVTIRVPADRFNEAMDEIKGLAVEVESEKETAKDVTEEFVDLEAQLTNLRAEESQYLELMERADDIDDILSVAQKLSQVRGKIERIEGRLKYLSDRVDMASIEISLTSEAEVEVFGVRWRPLYIIKKSFKGMLSGLSNYVDSLIRFIFALPVIVLWLVSLGLLGFISIKIFLWVIRKMRKR